MSLAMTCGNAIFQTISSVLLDMFLDVPYGLPMTPKSLTPADKAERERVGVTLRTLRLTRGWKLGDFATELGISYAYLSNIEAGRKPLPDHLLARAALLLDIEQIAIKRPEAA